MNEYSTVSGSGGGSGWEGSWENLGDREGGARKA